MVITEFFESCFLQNVVCLLCFQICPEILRVSLRFQSRKLKPKELTLCHKLWFSNPNIFGTQCRKPLIFQTYIFWSNKSHSFKFQRFTTLESKNIGIRKSEFVAKSQFLSVKSGSWVMIGHISYKTAIKFFKKKLRNPALPRLQKVAPAVYLHLIYFTGKLNFRF